MAGVLAIELTASLDKVFAARNKPGGIQFMMGLGIGGGAADQHQG